MDKAKGEVSVGSVNTSTNWRLVRCVRIDGRDRAIDRDESTSGHDIDHQRISGYIWTYRRVMDLNALKLELIERIAHLDDEARLLALKRLLDSPPSYAMPGDHFSMVREGETPYFKLEDRNYTAAEVRSLLDEVLRRMDDGADDPVALLSPEEWDELDADHAAYLRGEGRNYSWEEVKEQLRKDRGE
ncbi:MAG: hypothetical protein KF797_14170 [Flavobacteriales bacterium]|nr:hypothetical protein [Flavobacteriales bacterium]